MQGPTEPLQLKDSRLQLHSKFGSHKVELVTERIFKLIKILDTQSTLTLIHPRLVKAIQPHMESISLNHTFLKKYEVAQHS